MERSVRIKMISSHIWLAHPGTNLFHAYLSGKDGTHSVCESGVSIFNFGKMSLPGVRSLCCLLCFRELYGMDFSGDLEVTRMIEGKS